MLTWPFLSHFVTHLADFAHIEELHDALSGPNSNILRIDLCDVIT